MPRDWRSEQRISWPSPSSCRAWLQNLGCYGLGSAGWFIRKQFRKGLSLHKGSEMMVIQNMCILDFWQPCSLWRNSPSASRDPESRTWNRAWRKGARTICFVPTAIHNQIKTCCLLLFLPYLVNCRNLLRNLLIHFRRRAWLNVIAQMFDWHFPSSYQRYWPVFWGGKQWSFGVAGPIEKI